MQTHYESLSADDEYELEIPRNQECYFRELMTQPDNEKGNRTNKSLAIQNFSRFFKIISETFW